MLPICFFPGVIDKLDYIQGMGFDCIWITPVVKSLDYTGYFAEEKHSQLWTDQFRVSELCFWFDMLKGWFHPLWCWKAVLVEHPKSSLFLSENLVTKSCASQFGISSFAYLKDVIKKSLPRCDAFQIFDFRTSSQWIHIWAPKRPWKICLRNFMSVAWTHFWTAKLGVSMSTEDQKTDVFFNVLKFMLNLFLNCDKSLSSASLKKVSS